MKQSYFTQQEFIDRRNRVFDIIGKDAVALVCGAGPVAGFENFRQFNDFYYLTGIEVPQSYLLLDSELRSATLYLPNRDPHAANEGGGFGVEDADYLKALSGVEAVYGLNCLSSDIALANIVFLPQSPAEGRLACQDTLRQAASAICADPWDSYPSREVRTADRVLLCNPIAEVRDLSPILSDLRLVKSQAEVEAMRRAGRICARGVLEAMRSTRAGIYEYQLGAVADYVYRVNGVRSEGYRAIIATAGNIWYAHYYLNSARLDDGELVLMDYAPDISNYTSDIGRMWPVNGKYSTLQRELYGFVVEYHKVLLKYIRPHVLPQQVLDESAAQMKDLLLSWTFSKDIYRQAATRMLDFKGHLSHTVGMAVHDNGTYFDKPMASGLVFALDPQMWIPEERLYARVEDTVVVTDTGVEVLTKDAPLELDDVEAVINNRGIIQEFPMLVG